MMNLRRFVSLAAFTAAGTAAAAAPVDVGVGVGIPRSGMTPLTVSVTAYDGRVTSAVRFAWRQDVTFGLGSSLTPAVASSLLLALPMQAGAFTVEPFVGAGLTTVSTGAGGHVAPVALGGVSVLNGSIGGRVEGYAASVGSAPRFGASIGLIVRADGWSR